MSWVHRYESWTEYMADVKRPRNMVGGRDHSTHRENGRSSWSGTRNLEEAYELAENGWDGIRLEISQLTDQITDDLKDSMVDGFTQVYAVAGQTVDIGRYMGGEPENMVTVQPIKVATVGRVVTILVNNFYSALVGTHDIKRRGVAICGLVECLNLMQHETEIYMEITVDGTRRNGNNTHTTLVKLKSAGETLDIARLMFAIAHPANFRRIWFAYTETLPRDEQQFIGSFYGTPAECQCAKEVDANINLPILKHGFSDAATWVREQLFKFGLMDS